MTNQERVTRLVQEKQQAIARINQINGAIIELQSIEQEASSSPKEDFPVNEE